MHCIQRDPHLMYFRMFMLLCQFNLFHSNIVRPLCFSLIYVYIPEMATVATETHWNSLFLVRRIKRGEEDSLSFSVCSLFSCNHVLSRFGVSELLSLNKDTLTLRMLVRIAYAYVLDKDADARNKTRGATHTRKPNDAKTKYIVTLSRILSGTSLSY